MKRLIMAMLCVAGCSPANNQPASNQIENAAVAEEPAEVPPLTGEWSVTALGGQPLQQVFPMTASFAGDRMTVRSECKTFVWSYTQNRNIVGFKRVSAGGCGRNQTTNENEIERAMKGANIALFTGEGQEVQLSGNGGTATLSRRK
jgi:hypothetical protein